MASITSSRGLETGFSNKYAWKRALTGIMLAGGARFCAALFAASRRRRGTDRGHHARAEPELEGVRPHLSRAVPACRQIDELDRESDRLEQIAKQGAAGQIAVAKNAQLGRGAAPVGLDDRRHGDRCLVRVL